MSDQSLQGPLQAGEKKNCFRKGYPRSVQNTEERLVAARRKTAKTGIRRKDQSVLGSSIGLALSGGGIRSATFCLGILQTLARAKMLREIDFLSTVSGGGYIGSFLGRWFSRQTTQAPNTSGTDIIEATLGDTQSQQVKWLREHGRYVTPTGGGDVLAAAAHVLRSWIALHFNFIPVFLGLFCLLGYLRSLMFDVKLWQNLERSAAPSSPGHLWWSPWFILPALLALIVCIPLGTAFWLSQALTRVRNDRNFLIVTSVAMLLAIAGLVVYSFWPDLGIRDFALSGVLVLVAVLTLSLPQFGDRGPYALAIIVAVLLIYTGLRWQHESLLIVAVAPIFSLVLYQLTLAEAEAAVHRKGDQPNGFTYQMNVRTKVRNLLTERLGLGLLWFGILLGIAIIDTLAQQAWLNSHHTSLAVGGVGVFAIAVGLVNKFGNKLLGPKEAGGSIQSVRALVIPALALILATAYLASCAWIAQLCLWGSANRINLGNTAENEDWKTPAAARRGIPYKREEALVYPRSFPDVYFKAPEAVFRGTNNNVVLRDVNNEKYVYTVPQTWRPLVILGLCLSICWVLRKNLQFLNLSSYHLLYSARLTRAYLGATNPLRLETDEGKRISDPIPGDDCAMRDYAPHVAGGPLHLINVTINETVSAKSQVEQRDRKGLPMAIGPATLAVGVLYTASWSVEEQSDQRNALQPAMEKLLITPLRETEDAALIPLQSGSVSYHVFGAEGTRLSENLRLSNWIGISGAAFSTGAGAHTTLSLSILTGLANVRLGYWWDSGVLQRDRAKAERQARFGEPGEEFPLLAHLIDEVTGQFHGPARRYWYLSDGGHFENTGCYELLRRRLPLMIICDCGADPDYQFEDLANLVRKARVDFDTEIEFLEDDKLREFLQTYGPVGDGQNDPKRNRALETFGGLKSLCRAKIAGKGFRGGKYSRAHACLAKVRFDVSSPSPPGVVDWYHSLLLIIKPSLTGDEPIDLLQYHSENPAFPQEPTSDQFFDEAQWESYRRLGVEIGTDVFERTGLIERLLDAVANQRMRTPPTE